MRGDGEEDVAGRQSDGWEVRRAPLGAEEVGAHVVVDADDEARMPVDVERELGADQPRGAGDEDTQEQHSFRRRRRIPWTTVDDDRAPDREVARVARRYATALQSSSRRCDHRGCTTKVGTVLPPPAVTFRRAAVERRVRIPSM